MNITAYGYATSNVVLVTISPGQAINILLDFTILIKYYTYYYIWENIFTFKVSDFVGLS